MAFSSKTGGRGTLTSLEQLIEEINFQRAKEMRQILKDDSGFVMLHGTAYWTDLFVRHFLFEDGRSAQESDDLLFFIRKRHLKEARKYIPRYETLVEVFRRDSKKLPIGDPEIDWEETIYVNMIIHHFDYHLTLAVCTRTSPRELQVLKRHTERVWASPSRRLMSDKGTSEQMTYPDICFMLDNFDEIFTDILVRDGEMVAVELVARDRDGALRGVTFLGSVRYDALKKVYDARASISNKMAQRMTFGLFSSPSAQRMEFVRMRGPLGKGHAELAVTKPPGADCETPTSEPGFMLTDQAWDSDAEDEDEYMFQRKHQRRLSDPSANFNSFMYSNYRTKPKDVGKARSESEGLNAYQDQFNEIEAGDVRDELDDGAYNPIWTMRGFSQTFHFWKENRRASSLPLRAHVTYIRLPWHAIVNDLITKENREEPILTF
ncbi:uncharacterized protein KIAA0930 homolog [Amphibalanus amphitrite]|uniref:uncharacterized protein KIAA0930 homolog n=1 Tax=Amphibalanus amphitrite TaxID=1232801 RepID=UPI001C924045|nr:uncharacterized protein KIAA0930 homolog [Amphibalanus amphitrite]XP_043244253.1 uncharacterized protein KIAA0930 homolog [Amphibalanus amphitrite]XP_043244254.1 uncharacterized protein KIAA0930 homolog [Amphibalanus amphitrite]